MYLQRIHGCTCPRPCSTLLQVECRSFQKLIPRHACPFSELTACSCLPGISSCQIFAHARYAKTPACFSTTTVQAEQTVPTTSTVTLDIDGMHCAACSTAIERALAAEPGVASATVNLLQNSALVQFDPATTSPAAIAAAVEQCGFGARPNAPTSASATSATITINITGMTCGACSAAVESALGATPGVLTADVNILTNTAQITYAPANVGPRAILAAVQRTGFDAALAADTSASGAFSANSRAVDDAAAALVAALVFALPVFLIGKFAPLLPGADAALRTTVLGFPAGPLLQLVLTTPVLFVMGARFHIGAWAALKRRSANMDVLVSLGTNVSYFYGVASLLQHFFSGSMTTGAHTFTTIVPTPKQRHVVGQPPLAIWRCGVQAAAHTRRTLSTCSASLSRAYKDLEPG